MKSVCDAPSPLFLLAMECCLRLPRCVVVGFPTRLAYGSIHACLLVDLVAEQGSIEESISLAI